MKKVVITLLIILIVSVSANAQDKIVRKNGTTLVCKITEIGTDEIKYFPIDNLTGPIHSLAKDKIKKIVYENGKEETFTVNWKDAEVYSDQLKKAIKVNFLAPMFGYSYFTYEKSKGVGKSYELGLGIIGLGKSQQIGFYNNSLQELRKKQFGVFVSAGYKFNKLPDFLFGKSRMSHLMQGAYIKPNLYLGNYSENRVIFETSTPYVIEKQNVTFVGLQVELGKQWVFGDKFLLDAYWGFGYALDNKKPVEDYSYGSYYYYENSTANNYPIQRLSNSPGFSLTAGIRLGILIK